MGFSTRLWLTRNGQQYLSDAQLGTELRFTKIVMGDGDIGGQAPAAMTDVVSPKLNVGITEEMRPDAQTVYVRGDYTSAVITQGFYFREFGLYADQGSGTTEVLYCYGNAGALAEYIDAQSGPSTVEKIVALEISVNNAQNVTAVFSGSTVYALKDELDAAVDAIVEQIDGMLDGTAPVAKAAQADKLTTARTIQTNLASTSAASFNGTANVTPGITGTLSITNGGTGRTDGKAAALTTARSIAISGGATGTATAFDGSGNITIPVTALDMSTATAGTLPITRGGTGRTDGKAAALTTARSIAISGGATGTATAFDGSGNITIPVTALDVSKANAGTLPIANGGTALSASPSMLTNLATTTAASVLQASPRPGVTGTLPIANGGTGQTTAALARNALGLGNTTGALPIANGGTALSASPSMLTNLATTTAASVLQASPRPGVTGTLPIANGGTGYTGTPSIITSLASTAGASPYAASPRPGVTGTLPVANGGTGQTTAALARNALGLGNTTGALPIANGGSGLTTSPSILTNLSTAAAANVMQASPRPGVTGTLPIANGGTGATTAAAALNNLGQTVGTWTPTLTNVVMSSSYGLYWSLGRLFYVSGFIHWTTRTTGTTAYLGGLPAIPYMDYSRPAAQPVLFIQSVIDGNAFSSANIDGVFAYSGGSGLWSLNNATESGLINTTNIVANRSITFSGFFFTA